MTPDLFNSGTMPVLERMVQFTGRRHEVLTHNIANLSTPYFRPRDLSVARFQKQLRQAVDDRRETSHSAHGPLRLRSTRELRFHPDRLEAQPEPLDENILFHDRNNRDLERVMQDLAENTLAHNTALQLLKSEFDLLEKAIRGQP